MRKRERKQVEDAIGDLQLLIAEQKCGKSLHSRQLMARLKGLLKSSPVKL